MTNSPGFFPDNVWQSIFSQASGKDLLNLRQLSSKHFFLVIRELFNRRDERSKKYQIELIKTLMNHPQDNNLLALKEKHNKDYQNFIGMLKKHFKEAHGNYDYQITGLVYLAYLEDFHLPEASFRQLLGKNIKDLIWFIPLLTENQQSLIIDKLTADLKGNDEDAYEAALQIIPTLFPYLNSEKLQKFIQPLMQVFSENLHEDDDNMGPRSLFEENLRDANLLQRSQQNNERPPATHKAPLQTIAALIPYLNLEKQRELIAPIVRALDDKSEYVHVMALEAINTVIVLFKPEIQQKLKSRTQGLKGLSKPKEQPKKQQGFFDLFKLPTRKLTDALRPAKKQPKISKLNEKKLLDLANDILGLNTELLEAHIVALIEALEDDNLQVRKAALKPIAVLVRAGKQEKFIEPLKKVALQEELIEALKQALEDKNELVRGDDLNTIIVFFPYLKSEKQEEFIEPLKRALEGENESVRMDVLKRLPVILPNLKPEKQEEFIEPLKKALTERLNLQILAALKAISVIIPHLKLEKQRELIKPVTEALKASPEKIRKSALEALTAFSPELLQLEPINNFPQKTTESLLAEAFIAIKEHLYLNDIQQKKEYSKHSPSP